MDLKFFFLVRELAWKQMHTLVKMHSFSWCEFILFQRWNQSLCVTKGLRRQKFTDVRICTLDACSCVHNVNRLLLAETRLCQKSSLKEGNLLHQAKKIIQTLLGTRYIIVLFLFICFFDKETDKGGLFHFILGAKPSMSQSSVGPLHLRDRNLWRLQPRKKPPRDAREGNLETHNRLGTC